MVWRTKDCDNGATCSKQWQQVNEAPWVTPEKVRLAVLIAQSHQIAFQLPLLACQPKSNTYRLIGQELFIAGIPVIAHNTNADPLLTYANSAALQLWGRRWSEMIGMPSRLP